MALHPTSDAQGEHHQVIALRSGESGGHAIRMAESQGVIASITRYDAATVCALGPHYHENAHLCLLVEGVDVETRAGRSYARRAGDLHFYHAGEIHFSQSRQRIVTSALVELTDAFLARYALSESQFDRAIRENDNAPMLLLQIQHELRANDAHTPLAVHALVLDMVHYSRERHARGAPRWVGQVRELLHERWNAPLRLDILAAHAGVHPVTISKQFRKYFSCTLGEYRRRLMVRHSLPLVRESRMTLSTIALTCGFADQSHFTRTFRGATGFRPSDFRRL